MTLPSLPLSWKKIKFFRILFFPLLFRANCRCTWGLSVDLIGSNQSNPSNSGFSFDPSIWLVENNIGYRLYEEIKVLSGSGREGKIRVRVVVKDRIASRGTMLGLQVRCLCPHLWTSRYRISISLKHDSIRTAHTITMILKNKWRFKSDAGPLSKSVAVCACDWYNCPWTELLK
jgi:hypothetical protein